MTEFNSPREVYEAKGYVVVGTEPTDSSQPERSVNTDGSILLRVGTPGYLYTPRAEIQPQLLIRYDPNRVEIIVRHTTSKQDRHRTQQELERKGYIPLSSGPDRVVVCKPLSPSFAGFDYI